MIMEGERSMEHLTQLVRGRRSVRTFDGNALRAEDLEKLFMAELKNPYGIPVECRLLDAKQQALKCPVASAGRTSTWAEK